MVFYLKLNRNENYTYRNLQRWIDIISTRKDSLVFLLCDKDEIIDRANNKVEFRGLNYKWIRSEREDEDLRYVTELVIQQDWRKASYAHLTTFWHAKQNRYPKYWNIDADDTFFCLSPERTMELLNNAQTYADNNSFDVFSLDMWRSREPGLQWTFGITYTRMEKDWMSIIRKGCSVDQHKRESIMRLCHNIDLYFTFLGESGLIRAESFYAENLRYIHYSDDFFRRPMNSGLFHWKNGELFFPLLYCVFEQKKVGRIKIFQDINRLDIGISDEETKEAFVQMGFDGNRIAWTERMYEDEQEGMEKVDIIKDIATNFY